MNKEVFEILRAFKGIYQFTQRRSHYHYRGPEVGGPPELADKPSLRKLLAPDRRETPQPLIEVLFQKLFDLGVSIGYMKAYEEIAERKQKAQQS